MDQEDAVQYPQDFLNTLNTSDPPLSPIFSQVKNRCLNILLRNIKPPNLCNGTRTSEISAQ